MEIRKILRRFREFGGWRLVRTYWRMGVLGPALGELLRMPFRRGGRIRSYSQLLNHVTPHLKSQFYPLLCDLKAKYDAQPLDHRRSRRVWFCWLQGLDEAPELVRACLHSQRAILKDREIVVVTEANFPDYVTMPDSFLRLYREGKVPRALFSDLLRLELLIKYGGTWMDATVLCTSDNYPPQVFDCDLFMFQYYSRQRRQATGVSNWFITACTNNPLLLVLRDMLYAYWQAYDCTVDYYIFHQFFAWIAREYPAEIARMPRGSSLVAISLGQKMDSGEPYDEAWMQQLLSHCCFHKLSCRTGGRQLTAPRSYYSHIIKLAREL
ncbi:MAG: hypothetical protein IJ197_06190 [Bacteroidaceae bacterium]|nr:hypothetical protein [Bacteroidaceae bacterium]